MTRLPETTESTEAHTGARGRTPSEYVHAWLIGGFVWGSCVWLYEGVSTATSQSPGLVLSGSATLFLYEALGLTAAAVLGLLWAGVTGGRTLASSVGCSREGWTKLQLAPLEVRRRAIARLYARVAVTVGCLGAAFYAARELVVGIGNRSNLGLALVGVHVAMLLFGVTAVRAVEAVFDHALGRIGASRAAGFFRLGPHVSVVLGLCLTLLGLVLAGFWQVFAELLRRYALSGALGVLVAFGAVLLAARACPGPRARRSTSLGILALSALSAAGGAHVTERQPETWSNAPWARVAVAWAHFWLDWDRDAHLTGFGERDCSPFDASTHPGALDVPGNASDEDCDGADARFETAAMSRTPRASARRTIAHTPGSIRPNLYLITIDAFAPWTLEAYGGAPGVAPLLDRFAKHAVVFENFFVQGPSTRLSFPALFTSRYDTRIDHVLKGRFPFELAPSNQMLAEVLAEAGYETLAVIPSLYFSERHWRGLLQGFRSVATRPAEAHASGVAHTASMVTASALELLQRPPQSPRFLWVHYFDAHPPHALPAGQQASGSGDAELYAAEITHLDGHVAQLIDHIVEHDPSHVIVLTGDHGMAFDEPRHQQNHYGYDLSTLVLHVPLIVRGPGLSPRRIASLTDALDLAPTLTELAGITRPERFMGHSLVPLLRGEPTDLPSVRFAELYLGEEALRGREPLVMVAARTAEHNLVLDRRAGTLAAWRWREDPEERRDRWPDVLGAPPGNRASAPHALPGSSRSLASDSEIAKLRALKGALDAYLYDVVAPPSHSHRSHNETRRK